MKIIQAIISLFLFLIMIFLLLIVGWFSNDVYRDYTNNREYSGLWMNNFNETNALQTAQDMDKLGTWICVNIRGMEIEEAFNTCRHEVGHEIFARKCEKDIDKCFEVFEQ